MNTPLDNARYLSLGTQKRDGSYVSTPVWFAVDKTGSIYYVFSAKDAGKVKRLKNFSNANIAPCTVSGKTSVNAIPVTATLIGDDRETENAHQLLVKKYRWQMRILNLLSRLSGKYDQRQFIKITGM
jgi:PPOX class probable F420-dependent enzyme